jgi:hypothetical protein
MARFFAPLAVIAAAACESAWSVQGQVRAPERAGAPVAGAFLTLRCPGELDRTARSDREGLFEMGGQGPGPSLECAVLVTAPGRASARIPLRDACEDPAEAAERCGIAVLDVPLGRR